MCDTLVALQPDTADACVWFAKNSDREPGEAQIIEHFPQLSHHGKPKLQCTYLEIPQTEQTNEVIISRPLWMWGAEIGANAHGVAIGNEAVWTRIPTENTGLTGMDLLRLALERTTAAREALELITSFIQKHHQGGGCGYRNKKFRYHNAFIIADPNEAWVLETAGPHWVAEKVKSIRTISNMLSIGKQFDLISDNAYSFAKMKGWCSSADDFDFARCFGDAKYRRLSGGDERSACTLSHLTMHKGSLKREDFFDALRDHNGLNPHVGWRMRMPCAHSSWHPTRRAGQTTSSMVSRLTANQSLHWLTGTSSPCLSVFKPLKMDGSYFSSEIIPHEIYNPESFFWQHERLHRLVLNDYQLLKEIYNDARLALEASFASSLTEYTKPEWYKENWQLHRRMIPEWIDQVEKATKKRNPTSMFNVYWAHQDKLDGIATS
jgi:dipeptidase